MRGVRLIADGIPATMPDGQGQAATFDLGSADRIAVLDWIRVQSKMKR